MLEMGTMTAGDKPIHCLIYGLAACGKTTLVRDFPKPMLVIDMDNKYEPLIGTDGIYIEQFMPKDAEEAAAMIPKIWKLLQNVKKGKTLAPNGEPYATIVFDSLTAFDRMLERWAVVNCGKGKAAGDKATIQEYGDMKRYYRTLLPSLCSQPGNMIVLAHEHVKKEGEKVVGVRPLVTGSTGAEVGAIFPTVFHMEHIVGNNERRLLWYKRHKNFECGSSLSAEGSGYIENPTYKKIKDALQK